MTSDNSPSISPLPASASEITASLLTNILAKAGVINGSTVRSVEVIDESINATGITARLSRLGLVYDGNPSGAPRTLIVKCSAEQQEVRNIVNWLGQYEREVSFYTCCADVMPFRVPLCYAAEFDPTSGTAFMLLEDLGGYDTGNLEKGFNDIQSQNLVRMLARLHARWWDSPSLATFNWLYRFDSPTGIAVNQSILDRWPVFCQSFRSDFPHVLEAISQRIDGYWSGLMSRMGRPPQTLVHGDYQFGNFFFDPLHPENEPVVADFQLVMMGRGSYDLGYLLGGNLTIENRRNSEARLLELYYSTLREEGVSHFPYEQFMDDYQFGLLSGLFRYAYVIANEYGGQYSIATTAVNRFCAAVDDHQAWKLLEIT